MMVLRLLEKPATLPTCQIGDRAGRALCSDVNSVVQTNVPRDMGRFNACRLYGIGTGVWSWTGAVNIARQVHLGR